MEAAAAGIATIFCITEGIPALDMIAAVEVVGRAGARLIGPNCPGATSPGSAKVGIIPGSVHREGRVGVVSRSGTLTYEAVQAMTDAGVGQSTCIGIGGDPIIGTTHLDVLKLFADDPDTEAIVLIGEIGGAAEEEAAAWAAEHLADIPKVAFIAGRTAPEGKRMGHAGAIISGGAGTRPPRSRRSRRPGSASRARRPSCRRSCATPATGADADDERLMDLVAGDAPDILMVIGLDDLAAPRRPAAVPGPSRARQRARPDLARPVRRGGPLGDGFERAGRLHRRAPGAQRIRRSRRPDDRARRPVLDQHRRP